MFAESGAPDGLQILELQCHQTLRIPTVERRSAFCTLFGTRLSHFSITLFCAGVRYQWQKPRIEVPPRAIDVCERLRCSFPDMHTCSGNRPKMKLLQMAPDYLDAPGGSRCFQMDPDGPRGPPDGSRWAPDGSRWRQMTPDGSRWFQMAPDGSR